MKKTLILLFLFIIIFSCGQYQKAINGDDVSQKFSLGTELYEEGKFIKANRLFEQIVPRYRGKPQAQKLMYMHAMCFYESKDYYTANYRMEKFVNTYPNSEKLEEMSFLAAKSYYFLSPVFSKDQADTSVAIDKLQLFINTFPESEYIAEVNELIFELDYKLEYKAYSKALQYNTLNDHQSAIKSFDNFIVEFPGSTLRENVLYYKFDSAYKLAINSVEWKMQERINKAISYYNSFIKFYSDSDFSQEIDDKVKELKKLKTT
jgi:outer membrane protein assembly factor BamD